MFRIYVTTAVIIIIAVFIFSYFLQLCDSRIITASLMNSALNCIWKPTSHSSLRDSCDIGFRVQFNAKFSRQVKNFPILCLILWGRRYGSVRVDGFLAVVPLRLKQKHKRGNHKKPNQIIVWKKHLIAPNTVNFRQAMFLHELDIALGIRALRAQPTD